MISLQLRWCGAAGAENGEFLVLTGDEKWQFASLVSAALYTPPLHFCTSALRLGVRRCCEDLLLAQQTATFSHATQDKKSVHK